MKKYDVSEIIEGQTLYHETVADSDLLENIHRNYEKRSGGKRAKKIILIVVVGILLLTIGFLIFKPELTQNISHTIKTFFNLDSSSSLTGSEGPLTHSGSELLSGNVTIGTGTDQSNEQKILSEIEKMVENLSDSQGE